MIDKSLISVIIPVYNLEELVSRTLDSVCAQTYKNLEIIAVDDGSSDNSWQVLCDYAKKDSRVKPVHQENSGVTSARLNGVSQATGEWIGFVDGDDLLDADMFEVLYNNAIKYGAQISHCGYKMVLGTKRVDYYYNTGVVVEQDNLKGLCDLVDGSLIEPGLWNKLYHKSLFEDLESKMDFTIRNFEDLLMNYYLFKGSEKSVFEDVCKYDYIVRKNSAANKARTSSKFKPLVVVLEKIMADISDKHLLEVASDRYARMLVGYSRSSNPEEVLDAIGKLKKNKKVFFSNPSISSKNKLVIGLILYTPHLYKLIRKVYVKVTKVDQKYNID